MKKGIHEKGIGVSWNQGDLPWNTDYPPVHYDSEDGLS